MKRATSYAFHVTSEVRQGSSLSLVLFTLFVNMFIVKMRHLNVGCAINRTFLGFIIYADDLIVLSASVTGLQAMLDCYNQVSNSLLLKFNVLKSSCSVIGSASKLNIVEMQLGLDSISWTDTFKYLGVVFNVGRKLTVNTDAIKSKFYTACNCLLGNTDSLNEILRINLLDSYCLPILQYATAALKLNKSQSWELNACWNFVDRKMFRFP